MTAYMTVTAQQYLPDENCEEGCECDGSGGPGMRVPEVIFGNLIFLQRTPGPPVSGHHLILPEGVWLTLLADGPPLGHLGLSTVAAVRHDHTSHVDNDRTCHSQQMCCSVRNENVTHNLYSSNLAFVLFCFVMLKS